MSKRILAIATISIGLVTTSLSAAPLLTPADAPSVIGGRSDGTNFLVATPGVDGGNNNFTDNVFPANEPPADVVTGTAQKYLNFAELNTGFIVTPLFGAGAGSVANGIQLFTANDAPERDPASYQIFGTNALIAGAGPFALSQFNLISSGALALPAGRNNDVSGLVAANSQTVNFANATPYTTYLVLFPTVANEAAANSMQIAEVQIFGDAVVPEPATLGLLGLAATALMGRRRR